MPVNAFASGFQLNTTIHAAFWVYKPDFRFDPSGKEVMVNVNDLQYLETNQPVIRMPQITNISISGGDLTVTGTNSFQPNMNAALIDGLANATFLNGAIVPVSTVTPGSFTATMPAVTAPIATIQILSNVLTVTARQQFVVGMTATLSGLVNATFLNGQTVTIASVSIDFADPSGYATFTAPFVHADYAAQTDVGIATLNTNGYSAADSGTVSDPSQRTVWLYYDLTNVTTSERAYILNGVAAQAFIDDMEELFG